MFDTVKLLLPRARAWTTTVDRMFVRFLKGLALPFDDVRTYADRMWRDNFPQDTRFLLSWEKQFALPPGTLTDQERRDRLEGVWASTGGQSASYITTTLQARGFPVFTHPWFDVQPWGVPLAKDPRDHLLAEFGGTDGDGFLLANQVYETTQTGPFAVLGSSIAYLGEPEAVLGYFGGYVSTVVPAYYCGPTIANPNTGTVYKTHPYYMYIGGETFPDTVDIPASRRTEFERLVLQICPGHLWKVLRVRYV